jgi:hypothetical protein
MRKMAYEIRQRTEADYRFYRFQSESALLDELDHSLKITDGVLRFRIFKVDPEAPLITPPEPQALAARAGGRRDGRGDRRGGPRRPPEAEERPAAASEPAEEIPERPTAEASAEEPESPEAPIEEPAATESERPAEEPVAPEERT